MNHDDPTETIASSTANPDQKSATPTCTGCGAGGYLVQLGAANICEECLARSTTAFTLGRAAREALQGVDDRLAHIRRLAAAFVERPCEESARRLQILDEYLNFLASGLVDGSGPFTDEDELHARWLAELENLDDELDEELDDRYWRDEVRREREHELEALRLANSTLTEEVRRNEDELTTLRDANNKLKDQQRRMVNELLSHVEESKRELDRQLNDVEVKWKARAARVELDAEVAEDLIQADARQPRDLQPARDMRVEDSQERPEPRAAHVDDTAQIDNSRWCIEQLEVWISSVGLSPATLAERTRYSPEQVLGVLQRSDRLTPFRQYLELIRASGARISLTPESTFTGVVDGIREIMTQRGLTVEALGEMSGLKPTQLDFLDHPRDPYISPRLATIRRIMFALAAEAKLALVASDVVPDAGQARTLSHEVTVPAWACGYPAGYELDVPATLSVPDGTVPRNLLGGSTAIRLHLSSEIRDRHAIRLRGQGEVDGAKRPGDLLLTVNIDSKQLTPPVNGKDFFLHGGHS